MISSVTIDLFQAYCLEVFNCELVLNNLNLPEDEIRIVHIRSLQQGKGNGTNCMSWLLSMFAQYGVKKVHVHASPLGGMNPEMREEKCRRLVDWYRGFGFESIEVNWCGDWIANVDMEKKLCPTITR